MYKNITKKIVKAIELYNIKSEKDKILNIVDKNKIIHDYKSINFNNNDIIDILIVFISEKLGENIHILLEIYTSIRKSSVCVLILGEIKEPTFTDQLESYYLPLGKEIIGILRVLGTVAAVFGVYGIFLSLFSVLMSLLSYSIFLGQIFTWVSRSSIGEYISNISLKRILEHIKFRTNKFFEEQSKLYMAVHEHIKV